MSRIRELEQARAGVDLAEAERAAAEARGYWVNASVDARARWIEPSSSNDDNDHNDSAASRCRCASACTTSAGPVRPWTPRTWSWRAAVRRLAARSASASSRSCSATSTSCSPTSPMRRDNEAMAITYVRLERVQDRNELGQGSDVELRAQEARHRAALLKRTRSEANSAAPGPGSRRRSIARASCRRICRPGA